MQYIKLHSFYAVDALQESIERAEEKLKNRINMKYTYRGFTAVWNGTSHVDFEGWKYNIDQFEALIDLRLDFRSLKNPNLG